MFAKVISVLALVAPLVSGLTVTVPDGATSGGNITINWTTDSTDPSTWTFELVNPSFNNAFALANNVDPSLNTITIQCPIVPTGSDYTVEAVNIGNINQVYATSSSFFIGATVSSSVSSSTTVSTTGTGTNTNTLASTTTSLLPVTSSAASTLSTVSGAGTGSGTGAGTGTGTAGTTTPSTAAALSSRLASTNAGGYAVLLLSAVAGAAVVAL